MFTLVFSICYASLWKTQLPYLDQKKPWFASLATHETSVVYQGVVSIVLTSLRCYVLQAESKMLSTMGDAVSFVPANL